MGQSQRVPLCQTSVCSHSFWSAELRLLPRQVTHLLVSRNPVTLLLFPIQEEINSRRSPRTQRWQPSLFLFEITETRILLPRRIRSSWALWRKIPWDTGWIRLSWHCCWEWWVALLCWWTWIWLGWILAGRKLSINAHQQSLGISGRGSGQFLRGKSLWETFNRFLFIITDVIVELCVFGTTNNYAHFPLRQSKI